jgi:hypothetical protein
MHLLHPPNSKKTLDSGMLTLARYPRQTRLDLLITVGGRPFLSGNPAAVSGQQLRS